MVLRPWDSGVFSEFHFQKTHFGFCFQNLSTKIKWYCSFMRYLSWILFRWSNCQKWKWTYCELTGHFCIIHFCNFNFWHNSALKSTDHVPEQTNLNHFPVPCWSLFILTTHSSYEISFKIEQTGFSRFSRFTRAQRILQLAKMDRLDQNSVNCDLNLK